MASSSSLSCLVVLLMSLMCLSVFGLYESDITPDRFDSLVGGDVPALIEFYAPWCGHCKNLAPEYEKLGQTFKDNGQVLIGKVDADKHKALGGRHGVKGFPTILYFPKGSSTGESYDGGRTAEDMIAHVNAKAGTKAKIPTEKTSVTVLTETNFDDIVMDSNKDVLVEFYAPWCGHCKNLEPVYEKVAQTFESEADVVVAKLDAAKYTDISSRYDVNGYPTIKFFPKSNKEGIPYNADRSGEAFVKYLNDQTGTKRVLGGGFLPEAGRIGTLDSLASEFVTANGARRAELVQETEKKIAKLPAESSRLGKVYLVTMKRILKNGDSYVQQEDRRLDRLIKTAAVSLDKLDEFHKRRNILSAFVLEEKEL